MVTIPVIIRILRVFLAKSSEYVPERMIAVKMMSLMSNRCFDKEGKKKIMRSKQIRRMILFLVNCFCVIRMFSGRTGKEIKAFMVVSFVLPADVGSVPFPLL